jgi:hypothetical protein
MWKTKVFRTKSAFDSWMTKNSKRYQITVIFINNGYGVEYRPLRIIDIQ